MDRRLTPVLVWMAVIFGGSSIPGQELTCIATPDYLMHTAEYAVLGILIGRWCFFRKKRDSSAKKRFPYSCLAFCVVAGSIYGALDEFHQHFVPGRCPDPRDWAADTFGTFIGALIILLLLCHVAENDAEKPPATP